MQATGADEIARRMNTPGASASVGGALEVTLGNIAKHIARQAGNDDELRYAVSPVPISAPVLTGSGTIDTPELLGPKDGYWWDVRRLTVSGFTAGTVAVNLNDPNGENVANFTTAGPLLRPEIYLAGRDRLVFVATGITGRVIVGGQAIQVMERWWSRYLI